MNCAATGCSTPAAFFCQCGAVRYCSDGCADAHWKEHGPTCAIRPPPDAKNVTDAVGEVDALEALRANLLRDGTLSDDVSRYYETLAYLKDAAKKHVRLAASVIEVVDAAGDIPTRRLAVLGYLLHRARYVLQQVSS